MLDQITHLFRLRTILEEGSLRRASEKLNLTQPALSRSLAQLEAHFGEALVDRHARGVKATAFGERVLKVATRIERYWDIAELELKANLNDRKINLHVGVGPVWRSGILSPVFVEMQRRFPELVIEMSPVSINKGIEDLREGRLDVIFSGAGSELADTRNLVRHPLTTVTNKILAREGHPLFGAVGPDGMVDAEMLLDFPWIVYTEFPAYRDFTMNAVFERVGRDPAVRMICQNLLSALTMLQQSDSVCLLPDLVAIDALAPRIKPLPVNLKMRTVEVGMIFREELLEWGPAQALVELCLAQFNPQADTSITSDDGPGT